MVCLSVGKPCSYTHIYRFLLLVQKRYRYAILVSTGIYILQQFSGINVVVYFSGNIFNQMGFSKSESLLARYL